MKKRTLLSWSSGKDSAWALHILRQQPDPDVEVVGLFCTINQEYGRVLMHAVRTELLHRQARSLGLPIRLIPVPNPCTDAIYGEIMRGFVEQAKQEGIECFAFGDLFLEDVRRYRETNLAGAGVTPLFPLWGMPTEKLSREMVRGGLRAVITCVDPKQLPAEFAGKEYDQSFLDQLPPSVDPCGENGEFHSFAYDGPMFQWPVSVVIAETVTRDGFVFTDLLPGPRADSLDDNTGLGADVAAAGAD
jgi:uncharacterized protein (TIGR00290 family)